MFNAIRLLTTLISLLIVPVHADHPAAPRVVVSGFTSAERRAADDALALFAQAGLPLPLLEIDRHHDIELCDGFQGLHRRFAERSVIDICTIDVGDYEQRTLIHELAHAWTEHFLTDDHKRAFQDLRGWSAWLDYRHLAWEDNGAEQAAEIITWALSDHPVAVVKIHPNSCTDLHDGYVALTGSEPLHGYTKFCTPPKLTANRS